MPIDRTETDERLARIERMMDEYREAKKRKVLRRAMKFWRRTEAQQRLTALEQPPERIH